MSNPDSTTTIDREEIRRESLRTAYSALRRAARQVDRALRIESDPSQPGDLAHAAKCITNAKLSAAIADMNIEAAQGIAEPLCKATRVYGPDAPTESERRKLERLYQCEKKHNHVNAGTAHTSTTTDGKPLRWTDSCPSAVRIGEPTS